MNRATRIPSPIAIGLLLAAGLAVSACNRTDVPAGEQASPAARQAASQADAIAVPPAPEASQPEAASQPQAPASPVSSADPAPSASGVETAEARPTPPATIKTVADKPAGTAASAPAAAGAAAGGSASAAGGADGSKLYQVVDGYKVDEATMEGFRTWRAAACDRCHGANQEGMVGPSLIESLKVRDKAFFEEILTNGRLAKGMPSFKTSKAVMENLDELYAYLKGRSDGAITRAKVEPMK